MALLHLRMVRLVHLLRLVIRDVDLHDFHFVVQLQVLLLQVLHLLSQLHHKHVAVELAFLLLLKFRLSYLLLLVLLHCRSIRLSQRVLKNVIVCLHLELLRLRCTDDRADFLLMNRGQVDASFILHFISINHL